MRHTTLLSALSLAALTACASSSSTPAVTEGTMAVPTTRIVGNGGSIEVHTGTSVGKNVVIVQGTPKEVWSLLVAAYDSVGIPVNISNPPQGVLGNEGFRIRRKLKDVSLTRYLDCGNTQGGPSAETYEVILAVKTQLLPVDQGVSATTMVDASARPVSLSGNAVRCGSTGRLEARIGELLGGEPPTE